MILKVEININIEADTTCQVEIDIYFQRCPGLKVLNGIGSGGSF
jgi:hypothetical protein